MVWNFQIDLKFLMVWKYPLVLPSYTKHGLCDMLCLWVENSKERDKLELGLGVVNDERLFFQWATCERCHRSKKTTNAHKNIETDINLRPNGSWLKIKRSWMREGWLLPGCWSKNRKFIWPVMKSPLKRVFRFKTKIRMKTFFVSKRKTENSRFKMF